ncbi:MAG: 2-polyprenyl-3-methyl-6-methoxy-1,4-benzoquinone monooxygenase [Betaproteobacteria bacterium]
MMLIDSFIVGFDAALRTIFARAQSVRPTPGAELPEGRLSEQEKSMVVGLMRVNHCGEVCAQALYQGQSLTAKKDEIRDALKRAGEEETEHLAWTQSRIDQLGGHKSYLNPLWYVGAFSFGVLAGRFGERWNLGFLAETERQVEAHLLGHLGRIPAQDQKSLRIVEQMKTDEARHADTALRLGAAELPWPVKGAMRAAAKVMTRTAFYI